MIDMLLQYEDDEDAMVALAAHGYVIDGSWAPSVTPGMKVLLKNGELADGYHVGITIPERDESVEKQAWMVLDRRIGGELLSDYVITSPWDDEKVDAIKDILPVWPGSEYPLGADLGNA